MAEIGHLDSQREMIEDNIKLALDGAAEIPVAATGAVAFVGGVGALPSCLGEARVPNRLGRWADDEIWPDLL